MLPKDPVILLSVVNTWLRDKYSSLQALCEDNEISTEFLENELEKINYRYDEATNRFI